MNGAPLAADFPAATREQWLSLVEKTLKGAALDTLNSQTADHLTIEPLYAPARVAPAPIRPHHADAAWDIRAPIRHPHRDRANAQLRQALAGGAASVLLRLDASGQDGVAVGSAADLEQVLDGVLIDIAPIALDAGFLGPQAADWLAEVGKASPAAQFAFYLDPLSAFARTGASPGPIESHMIAAANTAVRLAESYPKASLFLASGAVVHEAGGSEAQELAFMAAAGVAYAKALARAGMGLPAALAGIVVGVAADADYFVSIAKLRAARLIWTRILEACGADASMRLEARSSQRMLTAADPWTNLIRLTTAGFAGAVGGADVLALGAFTDALGLPTDFALRQARNTQLILMEEAHVGRVSDPGAGAGYLEHLSQDLAGAAWAQFQVIEAAGGLVAALASGHFAAKVEDARTALAAKLAAGEAKIVGVTDFKNADARAVDVEAAAPVTASAPDPRLPGPDGRCPPLTPVRLEALV